jgi:hypothetical protein
LLFFLLQKCCCFFWIPQKSFFVSVSCFVLAASLLIRFVSISFLETTVLKLGCIVCSILQRSASLSRDQACSVSCLVLTVDCRLSEFPHFLLFPMSLSNCEGSRNSLSLFKVQDVVFSLCPRKIVSAKAVSTAGSCTCYRRFPEQYLAADAAVMSHVS